MRLALTRQPPQLCVIGRLHARYRAGTRHSLEWGAWARPPRNHGRHRRVMVSSHRRCMILLSRDPRFAECLWSPSRT